MKDYLKKQIIDSVESDLNELLEIKKYLYENPEVGGTEALARARLIQFMKDNGFTVTAPVLEIPNSFRAEYDSGKPGSTIGLTAEYDALIRKSVAAVKKAREGYEVENVYVVWLQGESDAICQTGGTAYKERLSRFADELFEKVGIDKFGIIRVGRFTRDSRDDEIIEAQNEICREDERFLMLTEIATELNEIPEYMHPTIGGHYSARGLQKLGEAAAEALAEYKISQK